MLELNKVAVTGRLGVGKSAVCQFFKELGAQTASADAIVHHLLTSSTKIKDQIIALLGERVVVEGTIDRSRIAEMVFQDQNKLKKLEAILHPVVRKTLKKLFQEASKSQTPLIIVEVPLLYEAHFENEFDAIVVVTSSKARGHHIERQSRLQRQIPQLELIARSDYHLINEGSLEDLKKSVQTLYPQLI